MEVSQIDTAGRHFSSRSQTTPSSPASRIPANQVRRAVQLGTLRPGDQLPTVREVVARLAVNPNTVLRAYRELEHEGLVVLRAGLGTFVADGASAPLDQPVHQSLREELARWVEGARSLGVDDEALAVIFDQVLHEHKEEVPR